MFPSFIAAVEKVSIYASKGPDVNDDELGGIAIGKRQFLYTPASDNKWTYAMESFVTCSVTKNKQCQQQIREYFLSVFVSKCYAADNAFSAKNDRLCRLRFGVICVCAGGTVRLGRENNQIMNEFASHL